VPTIPCYPTLLMDVVARHIFDMTENCKKLRVNGGIFSFQVIYLVVVIRSYCVFPCQ
jgi:hypothetical protein